MSTEKRQGGCPTLADQAINAAKKGEVRIDLELSKAVPKAVKALLALVERLPSLKENIQLTVIEKVLKHNKDFMSAYNESLSEGNAKTPTKAEEEDEDEDYTPVLSLTSAPSNKSLN